MSVQLIFYEWLGTYKVVKWKCNPFDLRVISINEASDSEMICLVDGLWSMYRVNHWSRDNIRVYDSHVKGGLSIFHEIPRSCLRTSFGDIIAEDSIIPCDSLLSGNLYIC